MRAAFLCAALLGSCGRYVTPAVGVGTDYPCGLQEKQCPGAPPGQLACCGLDDVCGAPHSRCPAGMCCYDGPSFAKGGSSAPRMHPQTLISR